MLPSTHRYPLRQDRSFFSTARRYSVPLFTAWVKETGGVFRAQVLVSKKTCKLATDRNWLKRKISNVLESMLNEYPGRILVLAMKSGAAKATELEIKQEIAGVLAKNQTGYK